MNNSGEGTTEALNQIKYNNLNNILNAFIKNPSLTYIYTGGIVSFDYFLYLIQENEILEKEFKNRIFIKNIIFSKEYKLGDNYPEEVKKYLILLFKEYIHFQLKNYFLFKIELTYKPSYIEKDYNIDLQTNKPFQLKLDIEFKKYLTEKEVEDLFNDLILNKKVLSYIENKYAVKFYIRTKRNSSFTKNKIIKLEKYDILYEVQRLLNTYNKPIDIPFILYMILEYYKNQDNKTIQNKNIKNEQNFENLIKLLNKVLEQKSENLEFAKTDLIQEELFEKLNNNLQQLSENIISIIEKNKNITTENTEKIQKINFELSKLINKIETLEKNGNKLTNIINKLEKIIE